MTDIELFDLMNSIAKYYPVSIPELSTNYNGYSLWGKVLEEKINGITEGRNAAWDKLIEFVSSRFENRGEMDLCYLQFPSYSLKMDYSKEEYKSIHRFTSICLDVSLLANYYTVYIEDRIVFNNLLDGHLSKRNVVSYILSNQAADPSGLVIHLDFLKEAITKYFPDYQYIKHDELFNLKIETCSPYHVSINRHVKYSAFDFLFSSFYSGHAMGKTQIVS